MATSDADESPTRTSETCVFQLDTSRYPDAFEDDDPLVDDGIYRCRRKTEEDASFCVFHQLPPEMESIPEVYDDCDVEPEMRRTADAELSQLFRRSIIGEFDESVDGPCDVPGRSPEEAELLDEPLTHDRRERHRKRFVGVQFGKIVLTYDDLNPDDRYPIDLRCCWIGNLDLSNANVGNKLRLVEGEFGDIILDDAQLSDIEVIGSRFKRGLTFDGTAVRGEVAIRSGSMVERGAGLYNSTVEGNVIFSGSTVQGRRFGVKVSRSTTVEGDVSVFKSTVVGDVNAEDSTTVKGNMSVFHSTVEGGVHVFGSTKIEGSVSIFGSTTGGDVSVSSLAAVEGNMSVRNSTVKGDVSVLNSTTVEGNVSVSDSVIQGTAVIEGSTVHQSISFDGAVCDHVVSCTETTVSGGVEFSETAVEAGIDILDSTLRSFRLRYSESAGPCGLNTGTNTGNGCIGGPLRIHDSHIDTAEIQSDALGHRGVRVVSLVGTTIRNEEGTGLGYTDPEIACDDKGSDAGVVFDLRDATLGTVSPDGPDESQSANHSFDYVRFLNTSFDGFEFSPNRPLFRETSWALHETRSDGLRDIAVLDEFRCLHEDHEEGECDVPSVADDADILLGSICRILRTGSSELVNEFESRTTDEVISDGKLHIEDFDRIRLFKYVILNEILSTGLSPDEVDRLSGLFNAPIQLGGDSGPYADDSPGGFGRIERLLTPPNRLNDQSSSQQTVLRVVLDFVFHSKGLPPLASEREVVLKALEYRVRTGRSPFAAARCAAKRYRKLAGVIDYHTKTDRDLSHLLLERLLASDTESLERLLEVDASDAEQLLDLDRIEMDISHRETGDSIGLDHFLNGTVGVWDALRDLAESLLPDGEWPYERSLVATVLKHAPAYDPETDEDPTNEKIDPQYLCPWEEFGRAVEWRMDLEAAIARARAVKRYDPDDPDAEPLESLVGSLSELESTYVKAKRGASKQGDHVAAGQFFTLERTYARKQHWRRFRAPGEGITATVADDESEASDSTETSESPADAMNDAEDERMNDELASSWRTGLRDWTNLFENLDKSRFGPTRTLLVGLLPSLFVVGLAPLPVLVGLAPALLLVGLSAMLIALMGNGRFWALKDWLANLLLWAFTGYGERPQRVLGWAFAIIFGFAIVFWALRGSFVDPPPYGTPAGYLLVSLGSFVTMVIDSPVIRDEATLVRLLSQVEGFLGVSFVALIVFTLTRSIHR